MTAAQTGAQTSTRWVATGIGQVIKSAQIAPRLTYEQALSDAERWNAGAVEASAWCYPAHARADVRWCVAQSRDLISGEDLPPALKELLHLLGEESSEVVRAASKILRFGLGVNPWTGLTNKDDLEKELGDVVAAMLLLGEDGIGQISVSQVFEHAAKKIELLERPDGRLRHFRVPPVAGKGDE